jgi:hypothetical protein
MEYFRQREGNVSSISARLSTKNSEISCLLSLSASLSAAIKRADGYQKTRKTEYYVKKIKEVLYQLDTEVQKTSHSVRNLHNLFD